MLRELERLKRAAARVEADLRRTTGRPWACSVGDGPVLTLTDGAVTRRVDLDAEVEDEGWFAPPGADRAQLNAGLDVDAEEVVAEAVSDAMSGLGLEWPVCPEHRHLMGSCSGWWYCSGATYHDVAEVGSLPAG